MILTENKLRQIIKEEYAKLTQEADPIIYRGRNLRQDPNLYSQTGGGASDADAAMQTLFSIFSKKQDKDFTPDLKEIAKRLYTKYSNEFGEEVVKNYINKHKLGVILNHI